MLKPHGPRVPRVGIRADIERREDEADLAAWRERRDEPTVSWEEVLQVLRKAADEQTPRERGAG